MSLKSIEDIALGMIYTHHYFIGGTWLSFWQGGGLLLKKSFYGRSSYNCLFLFETGTREFIFFLDDKSLFAAIEE